MVGRWIYFWDSLFLGAMLNFRGVVEIAKIEMDRMRCNAKDDLCYVTKNLHTVVQEVDKTMQIGQKSPDFSTKSWVFSWRHAGKLCINCYYP